MIPINVPIMPMRPISLAVGERYGRLTAIGFASIKNRRRFWRFQCDCGTEYVARLDHVRTGRIVSCGCFWMEQVLKSRVKIIKHGMTKTSEFKTWDTMKQRCYNPKDSGWKYYGGRGIKICKRWLASFQDFYADMGPRPSGYVIDRTDNDGNYTPENCRWVTRNQSQLNRRNQWVTSREAMRNRRNPWITRCAKQAAHR